MTRQLYSVIFCAVISLSGCQKAAKNGTLLPTHPTTGKVIVNGNPASGGMIYLYPVSPQPGTLSPIVPTGKVREDGSIEFTSYQAGDGVPEGEYRVTFEWPDPKLLPPGMNMVEDPPDRLNRRFADPEKSKINVKVSAGNNDLAPFVFENVKVLPGSSLR